VDPVPMTWDTRNDVRPEDFRPAGLGADQAADERADDRRDEHEHHTT